MGYRCVDCGFPITTLYVQYSPGNIRLMKCENCKAVADEYIECEFMIILIDLILHKPKAYRHLLFNVLNQKTAVVEGLLRNATFGFILLEFYRSVLLDWHEDELKGSSSGIRYQKVFTDILVGNSLFLCVFLLAAKIMLNSSITFSRFRDLLLVILVSSYFKIFLVTMMVWKFPPSVIHIIDLFVLSSNMVALKGTWNAVCGYSLSMASPSPRCCVSLSAFYDSTILPCTQCSGGCQGQRGSRCAKYGENPSLLQQKQDPNEEQPPFVRCTNHKCPTRIPSYLKESYTVLESEDHHHQLQHHKELLPVEFGGPASQLEEYHPSFQLQLCPPRPIPLHK